MAKCKMCKKKFVPKFNSMQITCNEMDCAVAYARSVSGARFKKAKADNEKMHKDLKKKVRDHDKPWHNKTLQKLFNKFIRLRDADEPCISCGRHNPPFFPRKGQWDAGHFRSVGGNPELRFEEKNCFKECVFCNTKDSEHLIKYQDNLVRLFGQERVDWLKGPHDPKNYTIPDLQDMIKEYRQKIKSLES